MLSSIGHWQSYQGLMTPTSDGWIALNSNYTTDTDHNGNPITAVSGMVVTVKDISGISWYNHLANIKKGDQVRVTIAASATVDANLSWQVGLSGNPTYYGDGAYPYFHFPVSSAGLTAVTRNGNYAGEYGWTAGGSIITLEGPPWSAGGSSPNVSFTTTGLDVNWNAASYPSQSRSYPTREGWIRKEIYRLTQAQNTISHVYKDSLRGMIASFNDVGYINSEEKFVGIQCIHANAERAVAKLKQENNIILPILSISQTTSDNDDERRRNESVLINEKWWDADKERAYRVLSLAPRPVNVNYQLNIWCKYMADMDQILEQVRLKFNPEMQVPTKFSTLAKSFIFSEDDVTPVTASDKEDRVLKKSLSLILRTYIPSPKFLITSTGKITQFKVETS